MRISLEESEIIMQDKSQKRKIRDKKIDRITSSLHVLAQCAVGILSLIGTINIAVLAVAVQEKDTVFVLFGVIVMVVAIVLHHIILLWGLPQLIELARLDNDEREDIGLRCLICNLYYIKDWEYTRDLLMTCSQSQKDINEMFKRAKTIVRVPILPKRFGVLALLYIALVAEIGLFIYLCHLWGFTLWA